jgi:drug/metabolite transporter (DMT)-like permease
MSDELLTGAAWVFASAVAYALYFVGTGAVVKRIGAMRLAGLAGSASCFFVLLHYALAGDRAVLMTLPAAVWLNTGLMAVYRPWCRSTGYRWRLPVSTHRRRRRSAISARY